MDHHPQTKQNIKQYHEKACNHHEHYPHFALPGNHILLRGYDLLFWAGFAFFKIEIGHQLFFILFDVFSLSVHCFSNRQFISIFETV
jgi:hypothetical protein